MIDREIGPYRVKEQIPFRGPGRVFAGVHAVLGRKVTIRELPCALFPDEEAKARFLRAAKIVQRHASPHLAVVHLCQELSDRVLLVTEFLSLSLEDRLGREEALPPGCGVEVCRAVLRGVQFLHGNGIVHGGIGAQSVAFSEDGSLKLVEWWGVLSPSRKVPEGGEPDAAADLLAVGVLLQRLTTPGGAGDAAGGGEAGAGAAVAEVLARALATDPAERFATAGEFLSVLDKVPAEGGGLLWGGAQPAGEGGSLLQFPGRKVPWGLLFGLMLIPLLFASMTRKTTLPQVPHKAAPVEAGSEGDSSPGGALPGLLPIRKTKMESGEAGAPGGPYKAREKKGDRKGGKGVLSAP